MAFRMALVVVPEGRTERGEPKWRNDKGHAECVEFVRQTSRAPHTSKWRPGLRVKEAMPGQIAPYTAIATFVDGHYPTDDKGKHAAIYLSHNADWIEVFDEWRKQGEVKRRQIRFNRPAATSRSDNGDFFYVIEI